MKCLETYIIVNATKKKLHFFHYRINTQGFSYNLRLDLSAEFDLIMT